MRVARCGDKSLNLEHPQIMGVLNITPDSFSDGGKLFTGTAANLDHVLATARQMLAEGAAVLDVGGESTRPGAEPVSVARELERVIPVVATLTQLDTIISVDTRHAQVAQAAIEAGAHLINDVSAGADPQMLDVIAASSVGFALMHMQGTPGNMQKNPSYVDVVAQVHEFLTARVDACMQAGIDAQRLWIDPGFGFGKTQEHNLALLAHLETLRIGQIPILAGLSRKSMLGNITGRAVDQRVHASVAAALLAVQHGADMVRVHDVAATQDALKLFTAVEQAGG
jgi:dihydropteroate synthase